MPGPAYKRMASHGYDLFEFIAPYEEGGKYRSEASEGSEIAKPSTSSSSSISANAASPEPSDQTKPPTSKDAALSKEIFEIVARISGLNGADLQEYERRYLEEVLADPDFLESNYLGTADCAFAESSGHSNNTRKLEHVLETVKSELADYQPVTKASGPENATKGTAGTQERVFTASAVRMTRPGLSIVTLKEEQPMEKPTVPTMLQQRFAKSYVKVWNFSRPVGGSNTGRDDQADISEA